AYNEVTVGLEDVCHLVLEATSVGVPGHLRHLPGWVVGIPAVSGEIRPSRAAVDQHRHGQRVTGRDGVARDQPAGDLSLAAVVGVDDAVAAVDVRAAADEQQVLRGMAVRPAVAAASVVNGPVHATR